MAFLQDGRLYLKDGTIKEPIWRDLERKRNFINDWNKEVEKDRKKYQRTRQKVKALGEKRLLELQGKNERIPMEDLEKVIEREAEYMAKMKMNKVPPFYAQIPKGLILDQSVNPTGKLVFCLLHLYAKEKELNRFPKVTIGIAKIASSLNRSEESIRKGLRSLEQAEWIKRVRHGVKLPNEYVLYGVNKKDWEVWVKPMRAHLRISYDLERANKLRESLRRNGNDSCCKSKGEAEGK